MPHRHNITDKLIALATAEENFLPIILKKVTDALAPSSDGGRQLSAIEIEDISDTIDSHIANLNSIQELLRNQHEIESYNKKVNISIVLGIAGETDTPQTPTEQSLCRLCTKHLDCKDYIDKVGSGYFERGINA